jgi:hypothetical protein
MSFVRTGLPALRVSDHVSESRRLDADIEAPFLDHMAIDHATLNRWQVSAGRWLDIAGACAITLCICAWIAIRIAAN